MARTELARDLTRLSEHPAFRDAIVKKPITHVISEKISTLIASGILQVGDALPSERELAVALNVSRAAVRGGVQILAVQGILEISQGSRTRVRRSDVGPMTVGFAIARAVEAYDLDSVHAGRLLVERHVVEDAARHLTDERLHLLEALLETQKETLADPVRFLICDREFHVAVYQTSRNQLLADFATDLYAYMMEHRREAMSRAGAIAASYADHVAIVEALRARDAAGSADAFAAHTGRIYVTTQSELNGGAAKQT